MNSEAADYFPNTLLDNCADAHFPASEASPVRIGAFSDTETTIRDTTKERSDEDLLTQVSGGNKEALSILFRRHATKVFGVARRILKDDAEAEDLLQELFLFLSQKADAFDGKRSSAVSWIIQLAHHRFIDRRRYLISRQYYNLQELNEDRWSTGGGAISIGEVEGRSLLSKLREELSDEQRRTVSAPSRANEWRASRRRAESLQITLENGGLVRGRKAYSGSLTSVAMPRAFK